jgi:hypothetical protein
MTAALKNFEPAGALDGVGAGWPASPAQSRSGDLAPPTLFTGVKLRTQFERHDSAVGRCRANRYRIEFEAIVSRDEQESAQFVLQWRREMRASK